MKVNNSSNINKTNSYLWTQKLTMTHDIRNPSLGFEQAPIMWNVAGLNWLKRTPTSPPLFDIQHPHPYLISNIPTPIWSPTSQPIFELQHPPLYLISNSNLGINIQLKRSCKDLSPLKMFFGTTPTFLIGILHNCRHWLITVFKILYGKHLHF